MLTGLKEVLVLLAFLGAGKPAQRKLSEIVTIVYDEHFGEDFTVDNIGQTLLELVAGGLVDGVDGSFSLNERGIDRLKISYLVNYFRDRSKDL